ncbi:GNAT family N-acetyltransferase [Deinococcus sp.]|uniref:GNAT family N-acetyltransferase n=1 Tax=Deinococcus sp. TaxID=47478 RepID=UPI003C7B5DFF
MSLWTLKGQFKGGGRNDLSEWGGHWHTETAAPGCYGTAMPTDPNPPLRTPRLRLDPQVAGHAEAMLKVLADPRVHLYIPSDPPTDLTALRARYERLESRRSTDGHELWLNWTVFADSAVIGTMQATVNVAEGVAEVAYVFGPLSWGQGYATEAMRALLDFLHTGLGLTRFRAHLDTRNAASARLAERLGFVRVAELKGADEFKGVVSDEYVYELHSPVPPAQT